MSLIAKLDADLHAAMRAREAATVACIRQVKGRIQEAQIAAGEAGEASDARVQATIAGYVKSLNKASEELAAAGERSLPLRQRYAAEAALLAGYLPASLGEAETGELVEAAVGALPSRDAKLAGRVLGGLLKAHPGRLDVALTRRLIEAALRG